MTSPHPPHFSHIASPLGVGSGAPLEALGVADFSFFVFGNQTIEMPFLLERAAAAFHRLREIDLVAHPKDPDASPSQGRELAPQLYLECGLQVVEEDGDTVPLQLRELAHQGPGGEVPGGVGDRLEPRGEARLHQDRTQIGGGVHLSPEAGGGPRVTGDGHRPIAGGEEEADGLDLVRHRHGEDAVAADPERPPRREGPDGERGAAGARDAGEVGPEPPVEDVLPQRSHASRRPVHHDGPVAVRGHEIGEERHVLHVVEVRVREQDVVDPEQLFQRERGGERAGVDGEAVVDEEARRPARAQLTAPAAEDAELQLRSPAGAFVWRKSWSWRSLPMSAMRIPRLLGERSRALCSLAMTSSAAAGATPTSIGSCSGESGSSTWPAGWPLLSAAATSQWTTRLDESRRRSFVT